MKQSMKLFVYGSPNALQILLIAINTFGNVFDVVRAGFGYHLDDLGLLNTVILSQAPKCATYDLFHEGFHPTSSREMLASRE